jgi:hypothetical protein
MPTNCAFSRDRGTFYYWDSFEARLSRTDLSMAEMLMVLRTKIVTVFGIRGPTRAQLNKIERKKEYAVGDTIARFTLYALAENEIVTGGDDKHLDFRVSVQKLNEGGTNKVVLTTVVTTHNFFGKLYLFFILPFHRFGVKTMLSNAVEAKRV